MPGSSRQRDDERQEDEGSLLGEEEEAEELESPATARRKGKRRAKEPAQRPAQEKRPRRRAGRAAESQQGDGGEPKEKKKVFHFKVADDVALLKEAVGRSYFCPAEGETKDAICESIAEALNRTLFREGDGYERLKGRAVYLRLRQLLTAAREEALHELRASGTHCTRVCETPLHAHWH